MSNVAVPGSTMNELCQALEVGESITLALPRHLPAAAGLREVASELARLALAKLYDEPPPPQWETITIGGLTTPPAQELRFREAYDAPITFVAETIPTRAQREEFLQRMCELDAEGHVFVLPRAVTSLQCLNPECFAHDGETCARGYLDPSRCPARAGGAS